MGPPDLGYLGFGHILSQASAGVGSWLTQGPQSTSHPLSSPRQYQNTSQPLSSPRQHQNTGHPLSSPRQHRKSTTTTATGCSPTGGYPAAAAVGRIKSPTKDPITVPQLKLAQLSAREPVAYAGVTPTVQTAHGVPLSARTAAPALPQGGLAGLLAPRMPNTARGAPMCSPRGGGDKPVTLVSVGSMLPRPQNGPAKRNSRLPDQLPVGSPRQAQTVRLQSAPDTRSGVVYEYDGYEVFYGLGSGGPGVATKPAKRDGYEKFYGIRSNDYGREPVDAGQQLAGVGVGVLSSPKCSPRVLPPRQEQQEQPSAASASGSRTEDSSDDTSAAGSTPRNEVETFSLATPSVPVPDFVSSATDGDAQFFSVSTPAAPR